MASCRVGLEWFLKVHLWCNDLLLGEKRGRGTNTHALHMTHTHDTQNWCFNIVEILIGNQVTRFNGQFIRQQEQQSLLSQAIWGKLELKPQQNPQVMVWPHG